MPIFFPPTIMVAAEPPPFVGATLSNPNGYGTLSNGNLTWAGPASGWRHLRASSSQNSGKRYFEATVATTGLGAGIGFHSTTTSLPNESSVVMGGEDYPYGVSWIQYGSLSNLYWFKDGSEGDSGLSKVSGSQKLMAAIDFAAGKAWFGRNGTWYNSGNPETGANAFYTFTAGVAHYVHFTSTEGDTGNYPSMTANFGSSAFSHQPTGYTGWPA